MPLSGKKIAVLVENKYIPEEIKAYQDRFAKYGAQVDFISRIWFGDYKPGHEHWKKPKFYSDVDPIDGDPMKPPEILELNEQNDISEINLSDYAAIIMSANYTSVRLRWNDFNLKDIPIDFDPKSYVRSFPVPKFFARAMRDPKIVKGASCHGLWILTPFPELLERRKVICHSVVMADILACGAEVVTNAIGVVTDNDLVTCFSKHEVDPFIDAIRDQIVLFNK
jgi:protease I